jgi:hypothetical protein
MKCKSDPVIIRRCELYIEVHFKLQPEDGFMRGETCDRYVILSKYIVHNKVVIGYKLVCFKNYLKNNGDSSPENSN